MKTRVSYRQDEDFTFITDERLDGAQQVWIKFGKFIVVFQKTGQISMGGGGGRSRTVYPQLPAPHTSGTS